MYPPKYHQEYRLKHIKKVAETYPFATLISAEANTPFVTHTPLILHGDKLVGHIDANNPHTKLLKENYPVTAIFQGPQTYISPSIYTTKQLPTWNYIISHAKGTVSEIADATTIKKFMVTMTEFLETPNQNFKLSLDDPKMDKLIPYIHCFEIEIEQWEGKFKLSQDKVPADIENAKQELIKNNQRSIADFVNTLFENHFNK